MSDLLARLLLAGTPADLVAEVAMELARAEAAKEAIGQRRHNDRVRQAERRARNNVMSRDSVDICDVTAEPPSLSPNENNSNPHTHTPEDTTPRARKADFPRPDWADAEVWADFLKNRKTKRLPNTATAHKGFLNDIARIATDEWPPGRLLRHAAMKGWGAIYEPEEMKNGRLGRNNGTASPGRETGGLEKVGREVLDILASRNGNCGPARQTGPAHPGGSDGGVVALPAPDGPRWDDGCGSPRMAAGGL